MKTEIMQLGFMTRSAAASIARMQLTKLHTAVRTSSVGYVLVPGNSRKGMRLHACIPGHRVVAIEFFDIDQMRKLLPEDVFPNTHKVLEELNILREDGHGHLYGVLKSQAHEGLEALTKAVFAAYGEEW